MKPLRAGPLLARLRRLATMLKFRLPVASVVLTTLCIALTTHLVLQRVHTGVQSAVMELERGNAERMASVLSSRITGLQTALRSVADDPEFRAAVGDPEALRQRLSNSHTLRTLFPMLFVAMPDGRVVALLDGTTARDPGISIADRAYFQRTASGLLPVVSEPILGRLSKEPIVQLTMPVTGPGGRLVAVLGGTLRLGSRNLLADLTRDSSIADDPVTTIVTDATGRVLSHRLPGRLLQPAEDDAALAPAMQRWAAQGRPIEVTGDVSQAGGTIVATAGVPGADWMLLRVAREDVLLGGLLTAQRDSLWLAAGVAVSGGLVLLALLFWMLRPLSRLQRRALALGDADLPIDEGWPDASGEIGQLAAVLQQAMRDRSASERETAVLLGKMQSVMAAAPIGIAFSRRGRFELVSREFATLLGWQEDAMVGQPTRAVHASYEDYAQHRDKVRAAFGAGRPFVGEMHFRRRDGSLLWGRCHGRPVGGRESGAGIIWLLEDATQQRAERERLSWSASHDALTRLPNREQFESRLAALLAQEPPAVPSALLFIDLDHFKAVNDNAGHAAGDSVLKEVAALLTSQVRAGDLVARLGGDEFAVLLPHCDNAAALQIAEGIRAGARRIGVSHRGRRWCIGASIGAVDLPAGSADGQGGVAGLLASADAACYAAKHAGRDTVRLASAAPC